MKRIYYIYKLTSPSGKVYIGQTHDINRRFSSYRNMECVKQSKLYSSLIKYGWHQFKKEIIHDGILSREEVNSKEENYIDYYTKKGISLNITLTVGMPNIKSGAEHFASKPVCQINKEGDLIEVWVNATAASMHFGISQSVVSKACLNDIGYAGGYYWRFEEEYSKEKILNLINRQHPSCKNIIQLTKDYVFVKEWESQSKASKELSILQANIWRVLSGKGISYKGFVWVFKDDYEKGIIPKHENKTSGKPIDVYDLEGNLLYKFNSILEASKDLSIDKSNIIRNLNKKILNPKKYVFKYQNKNHE